MSTHFETGGLSGRPPSDSLSELGNTLRAQLRLAALTAYLIAVGLYLRARSRIRPNIPLLFLLGRAVQVAVFRWVGPRRGELRRMEPLRGAAYVGELPLWIGARSDAEGGSSLVLSEDERHLGPAHAAEAIVETIGRGHYYHWYRRIVFSSSDNTDPRTNGRRYTVEVMPE